MSWSKFCLNSCFSKVNEYFKGIEISNVEEEYKIYELTLDTHYDYQFFETGNGYLAQEIESNQKGIKFFMQSDDSNKYAKILFKSYNNRLSIIN